MTERHYPGEDHATSVPSFEETPLTRGEYISTMVHFYRGELHRATLWRLRLDNTTNWSILSVMGLVTFSLSEGEGARSHVAIIAGMALVFTFLSIEARRFRFFDVWRARTRMLEENFVGPILRRDLESPVSSWGKLVAEDLLHPRFKISFHQALRARLARNYVPLFVLLLGSWFLKISMSHSFAGSGISLAAAMKVGGLPSWVSLVLVGGLYGYLAAVLLFVARAASPEEEYWGEKVRERVSSIDF